MSQLDVTVPCGQEPGPFGYSHCLVYTDLDTGYGATCDVLCNVFSYTGRCCYAYEITTTPGNVVYINYVDCCSPLSPSFDIEVDTILYDGSVTICSRKVPVLFSPSYTPPDPEKSNCCDCFNGPGISCQPVGPYETSG